MENNKVDRNLLEASFRYVNNGSTNYENVMNGGHITMKLFSVCSCAVIDLVAYAGSRMR